MPKENIIVVRYDPGFKEPEWIVLAAKSRIFKFIYSARSRFKAERMASLIEIMGTEGYLCHLKNKGVDIVRRMDIALVGDVPD